VGRVVIPFGVVLAAQQGWRHVWVTRSDVRR
jgi:hypothetical protein